MVLRQFFFSGTDDNLSTSSNEWVNLNCADTGWFGLADWKNNISPNTVIVKNLRVKLTSAPGAGKSYTFTLWSFGSTPLTCTIADGDTEGSDLVNTKTINAGDRMELRCSPSNSPNTADAMFTVELESANTTDSIISGGTAATFDDTATDYLNLSEHATPEPAENATEMLVTRSGTIQNLYIKLRGSPGTGKSYAFTVRKNGADTALTATVSDTSTIANDTANSFTVVAGDRLTMKIVPSGTPSTIPGAFGVEFVSDVDNEYLILGGTANVYSGSTEYTHLGGADVPWISTESLRQSMAQGPAALKNLYVRLNTAPGGGATRTFTVMLNGSPTSLSVTISDTDTTGNNTSDVVILSTGDTLSLRNSSTGFSVNSISQWGVTVWPGPETKTFTMDAVLKASGQTKTFSMDAILGWAKLFTIDAILVNRFTKTFTIDAVLFGAPTIVSPDGGSSESSPVYLRFTTSNVALGLKRHFLLELDKTSSAFGDLELDLDSYKSQTNWQYWDGGAWQSLPAVGLDPAYYGNDVRYNATLTDSDKWWRVREKMRRDS